MGGGYSVPQNKPTKVYEKTVANLPSMQGKVVAITGCTTGTGFIAAKTVALKGGEVIMLNRKSERAEKALKAVQEAAPGAKVSYIPCDLSDFKSVREAAKMVHAQWPQGIDVLCNNAGVMALADQPCDEGFDVQMKTNHLSHYLLTKELYPLLEKKAAVNGEARVVNMSSGARKNPNTPLAEKYLQKNGGKLGGDKQSKWSLSGPRWQRYQQTKLANIVFTLAMHDKLAAAGSKVKSLCAEPGLAATNLQSTTSKDGGMGGTFTNLIMKLSQSGEDGACGILICMCDGAATSGQFYGPKNGIKGPAVVTKPEKICASQDAKVILWRASDEAIGEPFVIGGP